MRRLSKAYDSFRHTLDRRPALGLFCSGLFFYVAGMDIDVRYGILTWPMRLIPPLLLALILLACFFDRRDQRRGPRPPR